MTSNMPASPRYIDTPILDAVAAEIRSLEQEFKLHKALLLTEDDLQCHLFGRLRARYPGYIPTMDQGTDGLAIHSEVKFYDANGKLTLIPDLCIIPPGELSIYASVMYGTTPRTILRRNKLPSKGFEFSGDALAIELKYCRKKSGINDKDIAHYQLDFDKLKGLADLRHSRTQGQNHLLGVVAIFNKTDKGRTLVERFIQGNQHPKIRILYCTGDVNFASFRGTRSLNTPSSIVAIGPNADDLE
jgi:hypothetical protein